MGLGAGMCGAHESVERIESCSQSPNTWWATCGKVGKCGQRQAFCGWLSGLYRIASMAQRRQGRGWGWWQIHWRWGGEDDTRCPTTQRETLSTQHMSHPAHESWKWFQLKLETAKDLFSTYNRF